MTKFTIATVGLRNFLNLYQFALFIFGKHTLSDAVSGVDDERLTAQVDKYYAYLAAKIAVYGSWRITYRNPVIQCEAASWTYLKLDAYR